MMTKNKGGRPKGSKNKSTANAKKKAQLVHDALVAEVNKNKLPMIRALIESAKGMHITKKVGKNKQVVYQKEPNIIAGKELLSHVIGRPTERHEMTGEDGGPIEISESTKKMSREDLRDNIKKLLGQ